MTQQNGSIEQALFAEWRNYLVGSPLKAIANHINAKYADAARTNPISAEELATVLGSNVMQQQQQAPQQQAYPHAAFNPGSPPPMNGGAQQMPSAPRPGQCHWPITRGPNEGKFCDKKASASSNYCSTHKGKVPKAGVASPQSAPPTFNGGFTPGIAPPAGIQTYQQLAIPTQQMPTNGLQVPQNVTNQPQQFPQQQFAQPTQQFAPQQPQFTQSVQQFPPQQFPQQQFAPQQFPPQQFAQPSAAGQQVPQQAPAATQQAAPQTAQPSAAGPQVPQQPTPPVQQFVQPTAQQPQVAVVQAQPNMLPTIAA